MTSKADQIDNIAHQTELIFPEAGNLAAPLRNLRWAALNYELSKMGAALEEMVSILEPQVPLFLKGLLIQTAHRLKKGDIRGAELHVEEARRYALSLDLEETVFAA